MAQLLQKLGKWLLSRWHKVRSWWRTGHVTVKAAIIGALVAAVTGAVLAWIPAIYGALTAPPPLSTITDLMNQEVLAAKTHDLELVVHIYAPDAVVTDAGCYSNQSHISHGPTEITTRYQQLPLFVSLDHVNIAVTWTPNSRWATKATATAETIGVLTTTNNSLQSSQFIAGRELWTFALIDSQWRITSFTYNLCLPS